MTRRNLHERSLSTRDPSDSLWPGKSSHSSVSPEDIPGRWYPTSWGAGCGPDLSNYKSLPKLDQSTADQQGECNSITVPSFEIGAICPNCGIAKMKLDADERVSCPLCLFGGLCGCRD